MLRRLKMAAAAIRPSELAVARERCGLCGCPILVRLAASEKAVRCPRCGASAVSQSLVDVLVRSWRNPARLRIHELSAAGPLVAFLRRAAGQLSTSEFFEDVAPGDCVDGVQCQDVQRLTFDDDSLDVCTSTEVFQHVEDDAAGFAQIHRVLRPGGLCVFTVPLSGAGQTVERTAMVDGRCVQILPARFHLDRRRKRNDLIHRDYGSDIVTRLQRAGFHEASLVDPAPELFGFRRPVVVARKRAV